MTLGRPCGLLLAVVLAEGEGAAQLALCRFSQRPGDRIRTRLKVAHCSDLIVKWAVLAQLKFALHASNVDDKPDARFQEIGSQVRRQLVALPRVRRASFVEGCQLVNQVRQIGRIVDEARDARDMHSGVVPGWYGG